MLGTLAIPLQLMCQLVSPQTSGIDVNTTVAVRMSVAQETSLLPDDYTAFPELGVAYKYFTDSRTWNWARKDCAAHGARLAAPDSFAKVNKIFSLRGSDDFGIYVGINRLYDDAEWIVEKTGVAPALIPWGPADTGNADPTKKCAVVSDSGNGLVQVKCDVTYPYVCEIPISNKPIV